MEIYVNIQTMGLRGQRDAVSIVRNILIATMGMLEGRTIALIAVR